MSVLLTKKFSHLNAKLFKDSFADTSENKYVFLAKIDSYGDDDDNPDTATITPTNKRSEEITLHNEILALKKILPADVTFVTRYHEWTSGTVYNQYSDSVDLSTYTNQQEGDADNSYFVVTGSDGNETGDANEVKYVYKCLDNNTESASTVQPITHSTAGTQPDRETDGYVWKYMYSISQEDWDKWYGTDNRWVPIETLTTSDSTDQWDIQKNAVDGSVNHISGIANLTTSDDGRAVTLTGDGTGFTATVVYNSPTDRHFNITNAGSGYTNVTAVNVTIGDTPTADVNLSAVLSPRGGHGWDVVTELSGHYIMILVSFVNDEPANGYIYVDNDYRKVGIINVPNVKTTSLGVAGSSDTIDANTNALVLGERADAMVKDQRIALKYDGITNIDAAELAHERARDVTVTQVQGATSATGKIVHVDTSTEKIYIIPDYSTTVFNHTDDLTATILDSEMQPQNVIISLDESTLVDYDIIRDTGDIIYIDNLDAEEDPGPYYPVRRDDQTDKIDLVIEF